MDSQTLEQYTTDCKQIDQQFLTDVISGLSMPQKTLPCKYFYDEKGSQLFEEITRLEEYYVTRTELSLLQTITPRLCQLIGEDAAIIEPGAGAGIKIQTLLSALSHPSLYVPMDISKEFLFYSAEIIEEKFPEMDIYPIEGDFTKALHWPNSMNHNNRVVFFPGSTIGNFQPQEALTFLRNLKNIAGKKGALVIGVDLIKDTEILEAAYDDASGVTAKFNKNLLSRINKELDANFDVSLFEHKAFFSRMLNRVEMHLVSTCQQTVTIAGAEIDFRCGETIHTENSYKYSLDSFMELSNLAGWRTLESWTDDKNYFSLHYLTPAT